MIKQSFIRKSFLFILIFTVSSEILNTLFISHIFQYNQSYQIERQFIKKKASINILIAGDSHARRAVYPRLMNGVFMIATPDENYITTYYRLLHIINHEQVDIQLVLLPFDLHSYSSYRSNQYVHVHYWKKYINFWELGLYKRDLLSHLFTRLKGEFAYMNGVDYVKKFVLIKTGTIHPRTIIDGFIIFNGDFSNNKDPIASAKYIVHRQFNNAEIIDECIANYFIRTLDLLDSHNIDIVLVKYPITEQYFLEASKEIDIDIFYNTILKLIEDNGYYLPVLDYHDLFWNEMHYFQDAEHLNINGAEVFTPIIRDELINLGLYPIE